MWIEIPLGYGGLSQRACLYCLPNNLALLLGWPLIFNGPLFNGPLTVNGQILTVFSLYGSLLQHNETYLHNNIYKYVFIVIVIV